MAREVDQALVARARAQGWTEGLIERALAVRTPTKVVEVWLKRPINPNLEFQIDKTVTVLERLSNGPYRARELTTSDVEAFGELWANSPETLGEWQMTVERGPDPIAQFRLQEGASINVIERDGELLACTVWAPVNCLIGGKPISIHYALGLRVRGDQRGAGLGDMIRRSPTRALQKPTLGQVMFMRTDNVGVVRFFESVKFQAGRDRPQKVAAVAFLTTRPSGASIGGLRRVEPKDLERCAELINRTQAGLDLFTPYCAESLRDMLDGGAWGPAPPPPWEPKVYGWPDFYVIEDAGRIVACGGLWDRGRNMREVWRSTSGEERRVEVSAALDLGFEEAREDALADLLRHFANTSADLGRAALIADLANLPAVVQRLDDLDPQWDCRTLEWTPHMPGLFPETLGDCHINLRYW